MHVNYEKTFTHKNKRIFVPNAECLRRGKKLIRFCCSQVSFPSYFFHYQAGGHVAALHQHLRNRYFFRIDIQNFFYSISRRRVAAALHDLGYRRARDYAKWSCVKNPFDAPAYALPIGFVQSPVLASLVVLRSPLVEAVQRANSNGVFVSVYFDDFIGSSMEMEPLAHAYNSLLVACEASDFVLNAAKLAEPTECLVAFNCDLRARATRVTGARIEKFYEGNPADDSIRAFEDYCARVASANF